MSKDDKVLEKRISVIEKRIERNKEDKAWNLFIGLGFIESALVSFVLYYYQSTVEFVHILVQSAIFFTLAVPLCIFAFFVSRYEKSIRGVRNYLIAFLLFAVVVLAFGTFIAQPKAYIEHWISCPDYLPKSPYDNTMPSITFQNNGQIYGPIKYSVIASENFNLFPQSGAISITPYKYRQSVFVPIHIDATNFTQDSFDLSLFVECNYQHEFTGCVLIPTVNTTCHYERDASNQGFILSR